MSDDDDNQLPDLLYVPIRKERQSESEGFGECNKASGKTKKQGQRGGGKKVRRGLGKGSDKTSGMRGRGNKGD